MKGESNPKAEVAAYPDASPVASSPSRAASIALAVCLPIEGIQCEYLSSVSCTEAWPRSFCTYMLGTQCA